MSTSLTGSFVPSLIFVGTNPNWPTLNATFTNTTDFTLNVNSLPPGSFTAPSIGNTFTITASIFTGKSMSACQSGGVCWNLVTSSIIYASGTMTGTLAIGSSFNGIPITGTISITKLTFDSCVFSINGSLASPLASLPAANLGQIPVITQLSVSINGQTPTIWSTSAGKCLLSGNFALGTAKASPSVFGGIGAANAINFSIMCTPPFVSGATGFSGTIVLSSTSPSSPDVRLTISNGTIQASGAVVAPLYQKYSTFNNAAIKGSLSGSYREGVLTLNLINAQFVTDSLFSISPMIPSVTGTIDITLSAPSQLTFRQGWLHRIWSLLKALFLKRK